MPQMAPLMWSQLFLIFSLLMIVAMVKIYFISQQKILEKSNLQKLDMNNKFNWTW